MGMPAKIYDDAVAAGADGKIWGLPSGVVVLIGLILLAIVAWMIFKFLKGGLNAL